MGVRDQLTAATADLMRRHGVAGTGVSEILRTSGVARRSIYLNFPGGKSELVAAATRTAGSSVTLMLKKFMTKPDPFAAFAAMWSKVLTSSDFESGCPVVAAALGRSEAPAAADAAAELFREWGGVIAGRLTEDGIDDQVADSLATTIVAAVEGAVIMSQAAGSTKPLEQVVVHIRELIELHSLR
ncbi:helix-turn-helix domain-containing protein [Williamsia sp.]|uniref:TetR/AcrR family transcriptional regulator n=1 Tax=Williamsia sp. TaxID=1872085 RepID=UPI002F949BF6